MTFSEAALHVATEGHKGQTRWDRKTPYISHPIEVAKLSRELIKYNREKFEIFTEEREQIVLALAYCHDLAEDVERYKNNEELVVNDIFSFWGHSWTTSWVRSLFKDYLMALNKHRYPNYLDFVLAAKQYNATRIVKFCDITHNLLDLKAGSMRDKYLLAQYILQP